MIEEMTDISLANQWKFHVFEEAFPSEAFTLDSYNDSIYGICFNPPNCDVVCLTFLSNGKMCAFYNLESSKISINELDDNYLSVKTQFAGPEIHKQLITIFDYINKKYFENFDLTDEGNYWETKNDQLLKDTFKKYTNLINGFDSLLDNIPIGENETIEAYLIRIAEINNKKNDTNEG
ncbi:hypothetical protein [Flavobacterium sp.]|uniref:hypothetical protein n=1 Tax=Flavobacterium sp. TaxID=239 RepID=UPI001B74CB1D|nr:hypothetical protein [Flavobacterium sp.]MBP6182450.1 hypothetical protein [Flavobacterium sp.]